MILQAGLHVCWPDGGHSSGQSPAAQPAPTALLSHCPKLFLTCREPQASGLKIPPQMACGKAAPGYFGGLVLPRGPCELPEQRGGLAMCCPGLARPTPGPSCRTAGAIGLQGGRQSLGVVKPSLHSRETGSNRESKLPEATVWVCLKDPGSPLSVARLIQLSPTQGAFGGYKGTSCFLDQVLSSHCTVKLPGAFSSFISRALP